MYLASASRLGRGPFDARILVKLAHSEQLSGSEWKVKTRCRPVAAASVRFAKSRRNHWSSEMARSVR